QETSAGQRVARHGAGTVDRTAPAVNGEPVAAVVAGMMRRLGHPNDFPCATRTGSGRPVTAPAASSLRTLRGFAFDLDGCIWAGATLLPGAAQLVRALRDGGCRVVFVTNS